MPKETWVPHSYQFRSACQLLENRNWTLWLDPGMGKTSIVLYALAHIKATVGYKKTLIVGPKRVIMETWPDELGRWENFSGLTYKVFRGRDPLEIIDSTHDIVLVNYDYLVKMSNRKLEVSPEPVPGSKLMKPFSCHMAEFYGLNGLVLDELTAFKTVSSARHKVIWYNVNKVPGWEWRWGMTASPAANSLINVFGQARVIDGGKIFGPHVTHFRRKYFNQSYDRRSYTIRGESEKREIYDRLGTIGTRLAAEDYLDMPEFIENDITVTLAGEALKQYRAMERLFVTVLNDETLTAANRTAALMKCRQIAGGTAYGDQKQTIIVHDIKVNALDDIIQDLNGNPLLVFITFRAEAERLKKIYGDGAEVIIGGTSASETKKIKARWDAGDLPVLITHPQSTGHGLNFQRGGHHLCWFSPNYDYELYDQANHRLYRQGQKNNVVCHRIIATNTIDTHVVDVLSNKGMLQNEMFDYFKNILV